MSNKKTQDELLAKQKAEFEARKAERIKKYTSLIHALPVYFEHRLTDDLKVINGFFLSKYHIPDFVPCIFMNAHTGQIEECIVWGFDRYGEPDLFSPDSLAIGMLGFGIVRDHPETKEEYFGIEHWIRIDSHPRLTEIVESRLTCNFWLEKTPNQWHYPRLDEIDYIEGVVEDLGLKINVIQAEFARIRKAPQYYAPHKKKVETEAIRQEALF